MDEVIGQIDSYLHEEESYEADVFSPSQIPHHGDGSAFDDQPDLPTHHDTSGYSSPQITQHQHMAGPMSAFSVSTASGVGSANDDGASDVMSTSSTRPAWNAWSKLPSWVNSATTESGSRWKPAEASHGQPSTANGTGRREATHWSARARGTRPRAASATARGSTPCGGRRARALREAATPRPGRTRPRGCAAPPCVACGPGRAQSRQYSLDYARVHGRRKGRRTRSLSSPATTAIQAWSFETSESALVAAR